MSPFDSPDLSGRWAGCYRHVLDELGEFPIEAALRQEGERLEGAMLDKRPEQTMWLESLIESYRANRTAWRVAHLQALLRLHGPKAVSITSILPEESDLIGKVRGERVRFAKRYRGETRTVWASGGRILGKMSQAGHRVDYAGTLDPVRGQIVGEWTIRGPGLLGGILPPVARGPFELRRQGD